MCETVILLDCITVLLAVILVPSVIYGRTLCVSVCMVHLPHGASIQYMMQIAVLNCLQGNMSVILVSASVDLDALELCTDFSCRLLSRTSTLLLMNCLVSIT